MNGYPFISYGGYATPYQMQQPKPNFTAAQQALNPPMSFQMQQPTPDLTDAKARVTAAQQALDAATHVADGRFFTTQETLNWNRAWAELNAAERELGLMQGSALTLSGMAAIAGRIDGYMGTNFAGPFINANNFQNGVNAGMAGVGALDTLNNAFNAYNNTQGNSYNPGNNPSYASPYSGGDTQRYVSGLDPQPIYADDPAPMPNYYSPYSGGDTQRYAGDPGPRPIYVGDPAPTPNYYSPYSRLSDPQPINTSDPAPTPNYNSQGNSSFSVNNGKVKIYTNAAGEQEIAYVDKLDTYKRDETVSEYPNPYEETKQLDDQVEKNRQQQRQAEWNNLNNQLQNAEQRVRQLQQQRENRREADRREADRREADRREADRREAEVQKEEKRLPRPMVQTTRASSNTINGKLTFVNGAWVFK